MVFKQISFVKIKKYAFSMPCDAYLSDIGGRKGVIFAVGMHLAISNTKHLDKIRLMPMG